MTSHEKKVYEECLEKAKEEDFWKLEPFAHLKDMPLEDKGMWLWMRWKATTDLFFLGYEILGWKNARHRKSRKKVIDPGFHRRMAQQMDKEQDSLLLFPREHLKSSWLRLKIVKNILENPFTRNGLWSLTQTLARDMLKHIKGILCEQVLQDLFPEICVPRKEWEQDNADVLTMSRSKFLQEFYGDSPNPEAQIEVWGVGSSVTGKRYDAMFYDDILDRETTRSATRMDNTRIWWTSMQPIQSYGAVEKMVGTPYHFHDLYAEIIDEEYFPVVERTPAIVGGKVLYSYFTKKRLEVLRKRMGDYEFSCNYLLDVRPSSHRMFVPPYPRYSELPEDCKYYMAIDPASTTNAWSDQTGIAIGCVDRQRPTAVFFVEAFGVKKNPDELGDFIVDLLIRYKPVRVGIETNLSETLLYLVLAKIREKEEKIGHTIPKNFHPIRHQNQRKADRINNTIAAFVRSEKAYFPEDWDKRHPLFVQFDFFNPNTEKNKDDIIDACGMVIQTIEHFSQGHWFGNNPTEKMPVTWEDLINYHNSLNKKSKWDEKIA